MTCKTPEEMIITLINQNRGTHNFINKGELIKLAIEKGVDASDKMDKKEIAIAIAEKIGYSSYEMQKKFGITNNEVKKMEKGGFITVVGTESFRMYGKTHQANLYSPYDYFKSEEDVINWLVEHPKGVRRKDEN